MSTKPKQNKSKNKTKQSNLKKDWSFYAIIVCLVLIAIPASFFVYQGISAMMDGNHPIVGDRFKDQFDNVITKDHIKDVETKISVIENVESVSSTLITGTFRIAVVTKNDISQEALAAVSAATYATVVDTLPIEEYFKDTETVERYDLELAVHNGLIEDEENFILQTGTLNAGMDDIAYQFLTTPQSPEWVDEMWARQKERDEAEAKEDEPQEEVEDTPEETPEGDEG